MQHTTGTEELTLNEVKSHFDHWRTTRPRREKIPKDLWDKVKPLIDQYPISKITKVLSINTQQIRENITTDDKMNFVEAIIDTTKLPNIISNHAVLADNKTCAIELHNQSGSVLKINDYPAEAVTPLITQFMR